MYKHFMILYNQKKDAMPNWHLMQINKIYVFILYSMSYPIQV